jgi:hypothetical protein
MYRNRSSAEQTAMWHEGVDGLVSAMQASDRDSPGQ